MSSVPLAASTLPLPVFRRGKVREVYAVDEERLLLVASDRISAFDVVLDQPIPMKGAVLTQISAFWFRELAGIVPSHFVTCDTDEIIEQAPVLAEHREQIAGRSTLVRRTEPIPFECVVRGYLAGSAWKEYRAHGTLAGEPLPAGLVESAVLTPPIFSPATKATSGHDENITVDRMAETLGRSLTGRLHEASIAVYSAGRERAIQRGIIIADTKFEFGRSPQGDVVLIDELLTPDSSRFWAADRYEPGRSQASFDKQPLRDYLDDLRHRGEWNGEPPGPQLSQEVVEETSRRYQDAYRRVTGEAITDRL